MSIESTLEFKWGVSRGRDTYGYNICSLYVNGSKVSSCNGGGYDMEGTALGNWIARAFKKELLALKPEDMPKQSHWERAEPLPRTCKDIECYVKNEKKKRKIPADSLTCPYCGKETELDYHAGKTVDDGRYFYGLSYHDPHYNPGKAIIGKDCTDRTFSGKSEGKTVEQAEKDGDTVGLERYQAFYAASSKVPTARHTIPLIDGACGKSSVENIIHAIGFELVYVPVRGKNVKVYRMVEREK